MTNDYQTRLHSQQGIAWTRQGMKKITQEDKLVL